MAEMIQTALEHAEAERRARRSANKPWKKKQTANGAEAGANSPIEEKAASAELSNEDSPSRNQEQPKPVFPRNERASSCPHRRTGYIGTCEACGFPVLKGASCAWIANLRERLRTQPLRHFFLSSLPPEESLAALAPVFDWNAPGYRADYRCAGVDAMSTS